MFSLLGKTNRAGEEHISCSRHLPGPRRSRDLGGSDFPGDGAVLAKEDFPGPSSGLAGRFRLCLALFGCREITHELALTGYFISNEVVACTAITLFCLN